MNTSKHHLLGIILVTPYLFSSCIPIIHTRHLAVFKNCTEDTLYIGASHYKYIDCVNYQVWPHYNFATNSRVDTKGIVLWNDTYFRSDCFVYPDSICTIEAEYLFQNTDTCYLFLIKWKTAKSFSWDEICTKKLFHRWIVIRNKEGNFERNIKY